MWNASAHKRAADVSARTSGGSGAERGAALVEAAIAMPVVALLLFGVLEYGLLFGEGMNLASAMRAGARTAAAADPLASTDDYDVLQAVVSASGKVAPKIQRVVVYKSDGPDGIPPSECTNGTPLAGECNVYTANDLKLTEQGLVAGGHGDSWPASTREPGTDYVGIWATSDHRWVTGFFGSSTTVKDHAVMRCQPSATAAAASDTSFWPSPMQTTTTTTTPPVTDPPDSGPPTTGDQPPDTTDQPPDPPTTQGPPLPPIVF